GEVSAFERCLLHLFSGHRLERPKNFLCKNKYGTASFFYSGFLLFKHRRPSDIKDTGAEKC
ncbi:MAG: hypothetical protein WBK54_06810, partial [Bacilli bacterium]